MIRLLVLLGLITLAGCEDTEAVAQEKRKIASLECAIEANDWMLVEVKDLEAHTDALMASCSIDKEGCQEEVAEIKADVAVAKVEHFEKLTYCKTLLSEDRGVRGE